MGPGHRQSRHQGIAVNSSLPLKGEGREGVREAMLGAGANVQTPTPTLGRLSGLSVMAGLVPATPIMLHGRAQLSGSPGQARR